jgi:MFS family permease
MLQSLVSPALPTIQRDLHTTQTAVSWILIAWLLSASVATPILGRVGDMVGKERSLVVVLGAIVLGSLVAALAPNIAVLIIGRVIQGLGGAVYPIAFGIIRDEFPRGRVPSAIGSLSGLIAVGGGLGTVLAGPIITALGWRWLFWLPMIVVALAAVACRSFVPESPVRSSGPGARSTRSRSSRSPWSAWSSGWWPSPARATP